MWRFLTLMTVVFVSVPSFAFLSLMDTGKLVDRGEYRVLGEGQLLVDDPKGFNLNARFSTGYDDESEVQFEGGVGSVDYYLGAFWKWIPFPDTVDQPAIGGRAGVVFADFDGYSTYGINVTPMISKAFTLGFGDLSPYGGIQMALLNNVDETYFALQGVIGVAWKPGEWDFPGLKDFNFLLEHGIDIDDSFSYFSFGANYNF